MALALFDFDGTLIDGDSDSSWNKFLIDKGLIDAERYYEQNEKFYAEYVAGVMDIHAYQRFSLAALKPYTLTSLAKYKQEFYEEIIAPMVKKKAIKLLEDHREKGDILVMITATNRFVVDLSCAKLGIPFLIACEAEVKDDRFTGELIGAPSFREGKWTRFKQWKLEHAKNEKLEETFYYGDSINDFFMMEKIGHPILVDGSSEVQSLAAERGWQSISLL